MACGFCSMRFDADQDWRRRQIAERARKIRREALEEACKAQCAKCHNFGLSQWDDRLRGWFHNNCAAPCDVAFIRALMEKQDG